LADGALSATQAAVALIAHQGTVIDGAAIKA
jgi:hypothetical protein